MKFPLLIQLIPALLAGDLSVRVIDPQNQPIASARVTIISRQSASERLQSTSANGTCEFTDLTPGAYFVQAEATGMDASAPQLIDLPSEQIVIRLGLPHVRSTVTITASGTPQSTDEISKSLTVVDGASMGEHGDRSISEALIEVPGLRSQQLGGPGATTYFKIRGLRNSDTAVLIDGFRMRDAAGTQADASGILQDMVLTNTSRIEVLRGAGSSLYGTNATGGVVNIVTDEGGGRPRGSLLVDGGALGSVRGVAHVAGGLQHNRLQYSAGISHWNVTRGVDDANPARNTSGQGRASYRLWRMATISGRIFAGDSFSFVRLTPRSVGTLPASGIIDALPVSLTEQHRYEAGTPLAQLNLGKATFLPAAFNSDSTRAGRLYSGALRLNIRPTEQFGITAEYQGVNTTRNYGDGPAGPASQPAASSVSEYRGNIQTANLRADYTLGRFQHIDAGYEFESENFQNRLLPPAPALHFFTNVTQRSHSLYFQDQFHFFEGRLQFAAAFRAQFFSLKTPYFEPTQGAPYSTQAFTAPPTAQTGDASAAYSFRRSGTKLRAHAGRGYRAPSPYERFGVFLSGNKYTLYGDPSLRPDRSSSLDGGIDQYLFHSRVQFSGAYFYTQLSEVVIYDTSSAINPVTDPLGRSGGYRNTHGGLARGAELSTSIAATRSLQLMAAYTYTDSRQRTPVVAGVWQTFETPRQQYSFSATEHFTSRVTGFFRYGGSSDFLISISGRAFRFDGRARAQAGLSYRKPLSEFRAVRFYARTDNLFNQTYFENGFRTPGITAVGGMQFEF